MQHADDPRRTFVPRTLHAEPRRQDLVGRRAGAGDRTRVRHVTEERAHSHDHLAAGFARDRDDVIAKGAPVQIGLDA